MQGQGHSTTLRLVRGDKIQRFKTKFMFEMDTFWSILQVHDRQWKIMSHNAIKENDINLPPWSLILLWNSQNMPIMLGKVPGKSIMLG